MVRQFVSVPVKEGCMGVERAVTRWYVRRQTILSEIALLEARLRAEASTEEHFEVDAVAEDASNEHTDVIAELAKAQEKLHLLGPCPKPMMG
jgi:hypothetical protein